MKTIAITTLVQLLSTSFLIAQLDQLYCTIDLPTDTIMIGQPLPVKYYVRNQGKRPIDVYYDPIGTYWNDIGRDETFEVDCFDEQGNLLEHRVAIESQIVSYSKYVGLQEIGSTDSLEYVLWLEDWVAINSPGTYRFEIRKKAVIDKIIRGPGKVLNCSQSIVVIPFDSLRLEQHLADLWSTITTTGIASRYEQEALVRNPSERAIPYLRMLVENSGQYQRIVNGIKGLSKYTSNTVAFQAIAKIFDPKNDQPLVPARTPILEESLMQNIRGFAFRAMSQFQDSLSLPLVLNLEEHPDSKVRMRVIQHLYHRDQEIAKPVIERRLNDESEDVRKEARWMFKRLQE